MGLIHIGESGNFEQAGLAHFRQVDGAFLVGGGHRNDQDHLPDVIADSAVLGVQLQADLG